MFFGFLWGIAGIGVGIGFVANEILYTNSYKKKVEKIEKRYKYLLEKTKELEEELDYYKFQYYVAQNQAIEYKEQYEKLKNKIANGIVFTSEEAKEMIKFAMTQAHPDKPNGSNERFIRYREIYEKVCK